MRWNLLDASLAICAQPELTEPTQPQTGTFIPHYFFFEVASKTCSTDILTVSKIYIFEIENPDSRGNEQVSSWVKRCSVFSGRNTRYRGFTQNSVRINVIETMPD